MKCCCSAVDDEPPPTRRRRDRRNRDDVRVNCREPQVFPVSERPGSDRGTESRSGEERSETPHVEAPQVQRRESLELRLEPIEDRPPPPRPPRDPVIRMSGDYALGNVPGVEDDRSYFDDSELTEDDIKAFNTAQAVVKEVRGLLPLGPFNNRGGLPQEVQERSEFPRWSNFLVDVMTNLAVEQIARFYPDFDPQSQIAAACKAEAVKRVGGGVCSMIATLCSGLLTTTAPPGTEIRQVYHNFDHEFVIIKVGGSRWFVVDPWPMNAKTIPFVDCSFKPEGVTNYLSITVEEPAPKDQPFGIDVSVLNWDRIEEQAKRELGKPSKNDTQMSHTYTHTDNVSEPGDWHEDWQAGGSGDWG
jgi:hypothetical protein